MINIEWYFGMP